MLPMNCVVVISSSPIAIFYGVVVLEHFNHMLLTSECQQANTLD